MKILLCIYLSIYIYIYIQILLMFTTISTTIKRYCSGFYQKKKDKKVLNFPITQATRNQKGVTMTMFGKFNDVWK